MNNWSYKEIEVLKSRYKGTETNVLSKVLGRSKTAIKIKASQLGITKEDKTNYYAYCTICNKKKFVKFMYHHHNHILNNTKIYACLDH